MLGSIKAREESGPIGEPDVRRIANTKELTSELERILIRASSYRPSRAVLAAELRYLSQKVASDIGAPNRPCDQGRATYARRCAQVVEEKPKPLVLVGRLSRRSFAEVGSDNCEGFVEGAGQQQSEAEAIAAD